MKRLLHPLGVAGVWVALVWVLGIDVPFWRLFLFVVGVHVADVGFEKMVSKWLR